MTTGTVVGWAKRTDFHCTVLPGAHCDPSPIRSTFDQQLLHTPPPAALRKLPRGSDIPWHRVINASGRSSLPPGPRGAGRQLARLAEEGVELGRGGRAVLARYRW
jgi:hypothetical protein